VKIGETVGEDGKVDVTFDLPTELADRVDTFCATHNMPLDEFFEKAMLNLMHSIDRDKHVLRLLELQFKYSQRIGQLSDVGIDLGNLVIDENLLKLALDMLEVPADTTDDYSDWYDNPTDNPPEELFCRDWFGFLFDEVVLDGTLIQRLEYVKLVRARVDEWNDRKFKNTASR
jgi:hypothetical protein